jgi:hypothetical protein
MQPRSALTLLFTLILAGMLAVTGWATLTQPVWQWTGLVRRPDHAWTIATLADAYCGFLTFYAWVYYKERWPGRVGWFVFIMLFGNIAMASYMLRALARLAPGAPLEQLLLRRAP